jgi:hypothetical protein
MEMAFLAALVPLLGLIIGVLLRTLAAGELRDGKPYFLWMRRVVLLLMVIGLLWKVPFSLFTVVLFVIGLGVGTILRFRYLYLGLAVVSVFSGHSEMLLFMLAMVFLYGLPFGTHVVDRFDVVRHGILYLLPFLLLFISFDSSSFLPAFVAGALFLRD